MYLIGYLFGSIATIVIIKFGFIWSLIPAIIGGLVSAIYYVTKGE